MFLLGGCHMSDTTPTQWDIDDLIFGEEDGGDSQR